MRSKFNVSVNTESDQVQIDVTPKKKGWLARFVDDFKDGYNGVVDPMEREKNRLRKDTLRALADALLKDVYAEMEAARDEEERKRIEAKAAKQMEKELAKALAG